MAITRSFPTSRREILSVCVSFHRVATPALPRGILKLEMVSLESQHHTNDPKFGISFLNKCFSKSQSQCSCTQTISLSLQSFRRFNSLALTPSMLQVTKLIVCLRPDTLLLPTFLFLGGGVSFRLGMLKKCWFPLFNTVLLRFSSCFFFLFFFLGGGVVRGKFWGNKSLFTRSQSQCQL